jgi:hypothetical protein
MVVFSFDVVVNIVVDGSAVACDDTELGGMLPCWLMLDELEDVQEVEERCVCPSYAVELAE